ncbi:MAG: hypothetical protein KME43_26555 [Myxacorys chilensis ATA2-1-KO14]|nr:hypothetical protein [Myxacorys chilensis ATA2-1-KO14]
MTQSVKFRLFGNGDSGQGMLFGQAAIVCGDLLSQPDRVQRTRDGDPCIRLELAELQILQSALEAQGYEISILRTKRAPIGLGKKTASLMGEAAPIVAEMLGLPLSQTQKSAKPLVRFPKERVAEVQQLLEADGFVVTVAEIQSNLPPKAVFRLKEDDDGEETYFLFDASAQNVAEALGCALSQTPGGRPKLVMTRQEYKRAKAHLVQLGFDISLKDLKLKAKLLVSDSTMQSAVLVGDDALEAAALLDKELRYTAPTAKTGAPLPMLVLLSSDDVHRAQAVLESNGYEVALEFREAGKVANVSIYSNGGIVFGEAAAIVADQCNFPLEVAQATGNQMVKVPMDQLGAVRSHLVNQGYKINESQRRRQTHQLSQADSRVAKITVLSGDFVLFKTAAERTAAWLETSVQKQGNQSILKLPMTQLQSVKTFLEAEGFAVEERHIAALPV